MATQLPPLPHLEMVNRGIEQKYKSKPGRGPTLNLLARNPVTHGKALRAQLQAMQPVFGQRLAQQTAAGLNQITPLGIVITFESDKGFDLAFTRLDLPSSGIELLNVSVTDSVTYATVFVPDGKLGVLLKKVNQYISEKTKKGFPKHSDLFASIGSIGLATIEAMWTDESELPKDDEVRHWEVWVRTDGMTADAALARFTHAAEILGLPPTERWMEFPERVVTLIKARRSQLVKAGELLNLIVEIRRADLPPSLSHVPTLSEQDAFVDELLQRTEFPGVEAVAVALLDTGVSHLHPLLTPVLAEADKQTVNPKWGTHDHHGHGTQMAGIAMFGNLRKWANTQGKIQLTYRLESVKILPPAGHPETPTQLFGAVTQDAVALCEIQEPVRRRVFCKAVSSPMHQDGLPSSYSAAIDQLAYGADGGSQRLFVLAAGNTPDHSWSTSPNSNLTWGVQQPGQAWNALTVGAATHLTSLPGSPDYLGWNAIASAGELSPFTSTSVFWEKWPVKPDVLFEGGNAATDAVGSVAVPPTMQLVTTNWNPNVKMLSHTCMTSPAAAQAAGLTAQVMTTYPEYWPETVRGLVVHHAEWTAQQKARFLPDFKSTSYRQLLRACGWGIANERATLNSAANKVSLVAQETLQPYKIEAGKGAMNAMRVIALPWPKHELLALGEMQVRLKVTLSYFIEPSPSKRGWINRYRYASHGLRFDLRRKNESIVEFNKRVNVAMRVIDEKVDAPDDEGWTLGSQLRTSGSIHSDEWTGMAAILASRDLIAVHPVVGWWRERLDRGCCENEARFSLIVSLEVPELSLDLYGSVFKELQLPLSVDLVNTLVAG